MPDDLTMFLRGMYETILNLHKVVRQQQVFVIAARAALKQSQSGFELRYAEQFEVARRDPSIQGLDAAIAVIERLIQQMGSDGMKQGLDEA